MSPDVERLVRELTPQVLGILARRYRNFSAAEDAVQDALLAAATQWPGDGVPENPKAWLIQVASRKFTDQIRSEIARTRRETAAAMELGYTIPALEVADDSSRDDTLILLYMCCHPALTPASAIALTLRAVGGLTTAEIARAFLVPEATMAQRITRAKQTIRDSGLPFQLPTLPEQGQRLQTVLHILYLIFSEGYAASGGDQLQRHDLAAEAIRLARLLHAAVPDDSEAVGLLALMLLTDARRQARTGSLGEIIPLDQQDRALWDRAQIEEGVALISATLPKRSIGPYQIQAAIAAVHDEAEQSQKTDWPQILALYNLLQRLSDNPMVNLNRAVAVAMVHGPAAGLELLAALEHDNVLKGHYRLQAVRGHLQELAGDAQSAIASFQIAAEGTASAPERNYLLTHAAHTRERWIRSQES